jgi:hypothetical protein
VYHSVCPTENYTVRQFSYTGSASLLVFFTGSVRRFGGGVLIWVFEEDALAEPTKHLP